MSRTPKEAIAIILDVGYFATANREDEKNSFLEHARNCVSMILKRKIFAFSKDEVSLILVNGEESDNDLNYKNVNVPFPLSLPSWKMLDFVEKLQGTTIDADWLDGLVVAMDVLKKQTAGKQFVDQKLVLFSNLMSSVSEDQVDIIIQCMKKMQYSFIVIGPDAKVKEESMEVDDKSYLNYFESRDEKTKTKNQLKGEDILNKILNETEGQICSFDDAIPQLMYFQKKSVRPMPWNVVMDIGPDIKINVSAFKKTDEVKLPTWKDIAASEEDSRVERETVYTRQDENQTVVEKEDVIPGFTYGATVVPFSDVEKDTMTYKSGEKCLSVLGFTKSENVPQHLLIGQASYYVTAQRGDEHAAYALSCIINGMKEQDLYAIARRVYRKDSSVSLGVLFPRIASKYECLVYVELPFSEDIRQFAFPSIGTGKHCPTQEQLDAIDALIDSMDLTGVRNESGEKIEAFKSQSVVNPFLQHVYHCLAHRAMNPDSELPPIRDDVLNLLKSPFEDKPSFKMALDQVKQKFQLTQVEPKASRKARDVFKMDDQDMKDESKPGTSDVDLSNITMAGLVQATVLEVGSVKPVEDFKLLLDRGEPFDKVCSQMQKVVQNLVTRSFGSDNFNKAESALRELRRACVDEKPAVYNDWVPKFREKLLETNRQGFWDIIVKGKLGLISCDESTKSSVSEEDARKFLEQEEKLEEEPPEDDMDVDDLLNQM